MTDTCLWCGTNEGLVDSHALKKRSQGGKETIRLCSSCDLRFDEYHARLVREGDFLVGYDLKGNWLGAVPANPRPLVLPVQKLDSPAALERLEQAALRADDDSLFGTLAVVWEAVDRGGWVKRVLCYAIKVRYGWREGWAKVAAERIDTLWGIRPQKSQIYQYANDWELVKTELSDQSEGLRMLNPTVVGLIWRAEDKNGILSREEARRQAANTVLEEPGRSVRQTAAALQERGLLSRDESRWSRLRRAAYAGDHDILERLEEQWIQSEWHTPRLLARYGAIGCFVQWAAGRNSGKVG